MELGPVSAVSLGAETMGVEAAAAQLREKTSVVKQMMAKIPLCQDTQVEFVLQRACLGVAKVGHLLRANGTELFLEGAALREFDEVQRQGLVRLAPGISELGLEQALRSAGLGVLA